MDATPIKFDFNIEGMSCSSCATRISTALETTPGVNSVSVNFAMRTGRVLGNISTDALSKVVAQAGYKAVFCESEKSSGPKLSNASSVRIEIERARREMQRSAWLASIVTLFAMTPLAHFEGSQGIQAILTTILIAGPARGFFIRSAKLLRHGGVNMDTLVAMGVGSAWVFSLWQMSRGERHLYFETAAVIAAFVLLGRWLEERARNSALDAIAGLAAMQPATAMVRRRMENTADGARGDHDLEIPVVEVKVGDLMVVAAGQACPTDGVVESGASELDESLVSGESIPVLKTTGSPVIGGTINCGSGLLLIRAVKIGNDTMLARIMALVQDAQAAKPAIQKLVDAVSSRFVPAVLVIAAATLAIRMSGGGDFEEALRASLAVLVIACPCALGLATPTAILAASGRAARMGILIRDPNSLQDIRRAAVLVIDKTGTVTTGTFEIPELWFSADGMAYSRSLMLALIDAAQKPSRHPLAQATAKHFTREVSKFPYAAEIQSGDYREIPGRGVIAKFLAEGKEFVVVSGNEALMRDQKIDLSQAPKVPAKAQDGTEIAGGTLVWFAINSKLVGRAVLTSTIRSRAVEAVHRLMAGGIDVVMASGDREAAVAAVARAAGIRTYHSGFLPEQKVELVKELQAAGKKVIMAGDGINDAPALAQADVGIAVGRGTDIAIGTAGLIIPSGDLTRIADAVVLSRATSRIIHQNLFWAFFYNTVAIPVAALGWLSPMVAAGAMALSSVSVVVNSLRLTRVRGSTIGSTSGRQR